MWGQGIRRAFSRSPEKYLRLSQYSGSDLPFVPVPTSPMLRFLLPIYVRCFR